MHARSTNIEKEMKKQILESPNGNLCYFYTFFLQNLII